MNLYGKFASVGGATLASRVLGFVREALMAAALGAGPVADAFFAAFRLPNFFRRFLAEGAFNSAFVPMLGERLERGGVEEAQRFASTILAVLLVVLVVLTMLAEIFMGTIVRTVIAPAFVINPEKLDLTILLGRIMFPYIALASLMAMIAGILNTFRKYFLAALAPLCLNICLVSVLGWAIVSGAADRSIGIWLSVGVLVGGLAQFGLVFWALRREGFRFTLSRPRITPEVKAFLWLAAPTAAANGIVQINLLVGQAIASAQAGAIALLQYADRLYQLPLGVIGIAIGVVLLPELTRVLAAGREKEGAEIMDRSVEFALLLILPASVGLFILADPITALLYERGAFTRETTLAVADAIQWFAIGLPAFMGIKIFTPAFFARQDTRTPMWLAGLNAIINIVLSLTLFPVFGHVGIAMATAISAWINAIALVVLLARRGLYRPSPFASRRIAFIIWGCVLLAAICIGAQSWGADMMLNAGVLIRLVSIFLVIGVAAVSYFAFLHLTRAFPLSALRQQMVRPNGN
ncbi:MAG: murein biosynthesis integral membrane protein MurJ [Pseudomonadota bacterium]